MGAVGTNRRLGSSTAGAVLFGPDGPDAAAGPTVAGLVDSGTEDVASNGRDVGEYPDTEDDDDRRRQL